MINKNNLEDVLRLSPMQENIFFSYLIAPDSPLYHEQSVYHLTKTPDAKILQKVLNYLHDNHSILRTRFQVLENHGMLQIVLQQRPIELIERDESDNLDWPSALTNLKAVDRAARFDLGKDTLIRIYLMRIPENGSVLLVSHHHVLLDGWSLALFMRQLFELYVKFASGHSTQMKTYSPYGIYVKWLMNQDQNEAKKFWAEYLAGITFNNSFSNFIESATTPRNESQWSVEVPPRDYNAITEYCARSGVTLNTFFCMAWGVLLSYYTRTNDVTFGTVVTNRPASISGISEMLGLFINTVPVRVKTNDSLPLSAALQEFQRYEQKKSAYEHLTTSAILSMSSARNKLIDHLLVVENYELDNDNSNTASDQWPTIHHVEVDSQTSYDLTAVLIPKKNLTFRIEFDSSRFVISFVKKIGEHYLELIQGWANSGIVQLAQREIFFNEVSEFLSENITTPLSSQKTQTRQEAATPEISSFGQDPRIKKFLFDSWAKILGTNAIDEEDNFFELGGTSIKIIDLFLLIAGEFGANAVTIPALYSNPTIAKQLTLLDELNKELKQKKPTVKILDF